MKFLLTLLLFTSTIFAVSVGKHDANNLELTHKVDLIVYSGGMWIVSFKSVDSYFGKTTYLASLKERPTFKILETVTIKGKVMVVKCEDDVVNVILKDWEEVK